MSETVSQLNPETAKRLKRLKRGMSFALFAVAAISAMVWFVHASMVSDRRDLMSNQAAGAASSHRISFNLTAGNTMTAGETVVIDFKEDDGGFSVSGPTMTVSDFDFWTGSTQRDIQQVTLGVPDCSSFTGTNDMVVSVDDPAGIITFTACGNFAASAPNDEVRIFIGSNSGKPGSVDRIVNPPTARAIEMVITEAAGECSLIGDYCKIQIAVADANTVSITAVVTGGGGGPGPAPDTIAPILSNIRCTNITQNSLTFAWDTNEAATTEVRYGITTSYGLSYIDPNFVVPHAAPVFGLSEATTYHYQVRSADSANNMSAWSADQTCSTVDETPPVISNVQVVTGETTATITWDTNEPATTWVDWGDTASYGSTDGSATPLVVTGHSVTLTGLTPGATYHFRVRSGDDDGNEAFTLDDTFTLTRPCATCAQLTYDVYIVNPDLTERHMGTPWVIETDQGGGVTLLEFEDKSITPGDPLFDHNDVVVEADLSNCDAAVFTLVSNEANWTHSVRLRVFVDGVEKTDTLVEDDSKASVGTSVTINARDLVADQCPGPPAISDVQVTNITKDSALVTWRTNLPANSFVDYGLTNGYGSSSGQFSPLTTYHSVQLTGLTADTLYHYRARSADASAAQATSGDGTFTTADGTPPVISNVQVSQITPYSARITWDTDEAADSSVDYGPTVGYGSNASAAALETSHTIDLTGLTPNTEYNFQVSSTDIGTNTATSGNFTFTTGLPPAPVISNVQVTNLTQTSARIEWDTDVNSDSTVKYGLTAGYGTDITTAPLVQSHAIQLNGLTKGTEYHYTVESTDAYGQTATVGDFTFTTVADTVPPANPSGLTAVAGDAQVQLDWTNPTDADFAGVRLVRSATGYPSGPTDGTTVYTGTDESFLDNTVTNGITYYYALFAFDDVPNYSSGAVAEATPAGPPDTTAPANVDPFTATPGNTQIVLAWTNPADVDFAGVRIVRKALTCPTSRTDGTVVYEGTNETRTDTGLANGTLYCYRAYSFDGVPNWSTGVGASATPVAPPDTTPPASVLSLTADAGDSIVQLAWTNPGDADWAGTRVLRKEGGYPTGPTDGTIVFDGAADSYLDNGVTNGTTYYYAAYAYDTSLNFAAPAQAAATPEANLPTPPPPACSDTDGGKVYGVAGTVSWSSGVQSDECGDPATLTEWYCQGGIGLSELFSCADGYKCAAGACIVDTFTPPTTVCGDGTCEGTENSISCPADCPITPVVPPVEPVEPTVETWERLTADDLLLRSSRGRIRLRTAADGTVQAYRGMTVAVILPIQNISKDVSTAFVNFRGSAYQMTQKVDGYEAAVIMPNTVVANEPMQVVVNYADGTSDTINTSMRLVDPGQVYAVTDGNRVGLTGARVSLYVDNGSGNFGLWNGTPFGQTNPQTAGENGTFRFIVPEGTYRLVASADGYFSKETLRFPITTENVISRTLQLVKQPEKDLVEVLTDEDTTVAEKAVEVTEQVTATTQRATESVREVINNPIVEEQVKDVAAPAAAAVAVANVVTVGTTTAAGIPYLMYLISFLAHPTLLFGRRRRKKWGVVYNSLSKTPVDLAIVRLLDAQTGRVMRSAVTDKEGRYVFIVQEGSYRLTVTKNGFVFPSAYMKAAKEDGQFVDLYHGEDLTATDNSAITANVPLDPIEVEETPRSLMWAGIARRFQKSLAWLSIIAMIVVTIISPTILMFAILIGNIVIFLAFRRLSVGKKPKNWGIVYDTATGKPLRNALARVFEAKYNKLLETQVTDSKGRYSFLVGKNVYYVTFEKPGYQKQQKGPVDLTKQDEKVEGVVAVDIGLDPAAGAKGAKGKGEGKAKPPKGEPPKEPEPPKEEPPATEPTEPEPPTEQTVPPEAGTEEPPATEPTEPKIPWELQQLQKMQAAAQGEPKSETPAEPEPEPKDDGPKIPWELQQLQKMQSAKPEGDEQTVPTEAGTEGESVLWDVDPDQRAAALEETPALGAPPQPSAPTEPAPDKPESDSPAGPNNHDSEPPPENSQEGDGPEKAQGGL
jgi:hypothetical protein